MESSRRPQYDLSVVRTVSSHKVLVVTGTDQAHLAHVHALLPLWAVAVVYLAILGLLIAGVLVMARAAKRMSRPGRIIVGLIAAWTIVGAIAVFLDAYRPTGDWGGSAVQGLFLVLYGLFAAGIVWVFDSAARRLRTTSTV
jgi:hypothetical protein